MPKTMIGKNKNLFRLFLLTLFVIASLILGLFGANIVFIVFSLLVGLNFFIKINYHWWLILTLMLLSLIPGSVYRSDNESQAMYLGELAFLGLITAFIAMLLNQKQLKCRLFTLPTVSITTKSLKSKLFLGLVIAFVTAHLALISPSSLEIIFVFCLLVLFLVLVSKQDLTI